MTERRWKEGDEEEATRSEEEGEGRKETDEVKIRERKELWKQGRREE